jgi:C1A family cysteine protease
MKKFVIFLCLTCALTLVQADPQELAALQQILASTRGSWTAGETSFSQLTPMEQEALMGLLPGISDIHSLPEPTSSVESDARLAELELKDTDIRNQKQCGSCYAFGACATYEGRALNYKEGNPVLDLSEQWFMMKAKEIGPSGGCSGWWLDSSMKLLQNNGVATEVACPYQGVEAACPSGTQPVYFVKDWEYGVMPKEDIQGILQKYGPAYVGFAVYSDFSYYKTGYYKYTSGYLRGYHAVAIIGYDSNGFKVKNSWGTGWGNQGYFQIAYDQMDNSVQFAKCFGGAYYITND